MMAEAKLVHIVSRLREAGIEVLVMGGHAVRYYGVDRNTNDFDLVTSLATPGELRGFLQRVRDLGSLREEPSWRNLDFARFELGRLPDGREEWLEFWFRNHLLPDFKTLLSRAEIGVYGGGRLPFLSIADLIRSKETERESDWDDIARLEEIQDARALANHHSNPDRLFTLLANVRSRIGMDFVIERGLAKDSSLVDRALAACNHPVTFAFLVPAASPNVINPLVSRIEPTTLASLHRATLGSSQHFALIEVCRRAYKRAAMDADRADKQVSLQRHRGAPS